VGWYPLFFLFSHGTFDFLFFIKKLALEYSLPLLHIPLQFWNSSIFGIFVLVNGFETVDARGGGWCCAKDLIKFIEKYTPASKHIGSA